MYSEHLAGNLEFHVFTAAPNVVFEGHRAPGDWIGYAERGSGELTLADDNGVVQKEILFSQGDVFVSKTDAMHGWQIGPEGAETVFVCKT